MANEKRLISLDEALEATHSEIYWTESQQAAVRSFLVKQPKADAVEVVHGRWVDDYDDPRFICEECGKWLLIEDGTAEMNYCPNCGADMRERKDND